MPVSPRDFELYSRMTGKPMPMDAQQRMQMAPEVFQFSRNFAKKPNILEKTGNLIKNIGKTTLMGAAGLAVAPAFVEQRETTADQQKQDITPSQTAEKTEERKVIQKVEIENSKNVAEDVVEEQNFKPAFDATPKKSEEQILSEMKQYEEQAGLTRIGGPANVSDKVQEFLKQDKLNPVLLAAMGKRGQEEELVGTSFPIASRLSDNPQIALDGGQSTRAQSREFIKETEPIGGVPTNVDPSTLTPEVKNVLSNISKGMATIPLEEQIVAAKKIVEKKRTPNLLEQRAIDNKDAMDSMRLSDEEREKESIRLGSTGGIPNKTDMAKIRKSPEFKAAQESMKPKSTAEKVDEFTSKIMPKEKSSFVESMSMDLSADKSPSATFNLNQKDGGTKPYSVELSTPMAVSLNEMVQDGSIKDESFGKLFNLAKKSIKDKSGMAFGIDQ